MIYPKHLWPLAAVLLLSGCGSSGTTSASHKPSDNIAPATVKPGEEANLFPVQVGNQWTYVAEGMMESPTGGTRTVRNEVTMRIAKVTDTADGKLVDFDELSG